jgi:hypothetical protein
MESQQAIAKEISIHDSTLLSYTVDCQKHRITLHTSFMDCDLHELTDVLFSGVVAYHFENDSFGTILFDIFEAPIEEIYADNQELFARSKDYGWPVIHYNTEQDLMNNLNERHVKGYRIGSSIGLSGFILAEEMHLVSV